MSNSIVPVIKYEGDNSTFIWKHPSEDFNSMTQLVVHESQEAIFFMNGQALDLFGPGRYTLETQNIPRIGKFLNRSTGDTSPFHSFFLQVPTKSTLISVPSAGVRVLISSSVAKNLITFTPLGKRIFIVFFFSPIRNIHALEIFVKEGIM